MARAAQADLAEIDNYSAEQFGDDAADDYNQGFWELFALLRTHPFAGPLTPDLGKQVRCLTHRRHRIFYRVTREQVLILRIIHHARNAKGMLGEAG
ncbi:type II toxin-antitoxin system RelE/ParE family toxin [Sphingobium sp. DEHP117]|uniref:type II toxin-antitoxin system RelE/ParE family toxin n=1 Tax=Sphingobium sp. DEHP117 TaxID=2993436 RepID=UPI0027D73E76|nr:type II toxin-antitoxin system RelE/ParE family toxin [Sphingobium sp. DEHP117]MDQ4420721.1 type II toxin-antitoxin system RelE/ParE family toxin [Sphingobium sp. DEHP117]